MQATRQQIVDHLRRQGRATVRELGESLGLTSTGIRQHLTVLERDGLVQASEERGHVGRPALVYSLTERGDALYPKKYDDLANILLEEVRGVAGSQAVQTLLKRVAGRFAEPYMDRVEGKALQDRVRETAQIIQERGCLAHFRRDGDDWLIEQYTCPFPNVARRNSGVCALDVEFIRLLVGVDARLSQSLLRHDASCTYRVRAGQPAAAAHR
jgi:predicted ArsR family transcriptional regulator